MWGGRKTPPKASEVTQPRSLHPEGTCYLYPRPGVQHVTSLLVPLISLASGPGHTGQLGHYSRWPLGGALACSSSACLPSLFPSQGTLGPFLTVTVGMLPAASWRTQLVMLLLLFPCRGRSCVFSPRHPGPTPLSSFTPPPTLPLAPVFSAQPLEVSSAALGCLLLFLHTLRSANPCLS